MGMFMGEFSHNIDAKGRLIVPAKFRSELGENMVVTRGLDGCLTLYTLEGWQAIYEKLLMLPSTKKEVRLYVRMLTSKASEVELDNQGRILIPSSLIKEAGIKKECMIVGAAGKVEIWAKDRWETYIDDAEESFESIAESLTDLMI